MEQIGGARDATRQAGPATPRRGADGGRAGSCVRARQVRPIATGDGQWLVQAWSVPGARVPEALFGAEGGYSEGSSGDVVYDLVDELEARNVDPDRTSIAFIVPRQLACSAIHGWGLPAGRGE